MLSQRDGRRTGAGRTILLFSSILISPVVLRAILLVGNEITPSVADLRGLVSDVGVSLALASLLALVARWGWLARTCVALTIGLWCLVCYANFEHVRVLDANATLTYAAYVTDDTFLRGSVLAVSSWWLLVSLLSISFVLAGPALRHPQGPPRAGALALAAVLLLVGHTVWPNNVNARDWRQVNAVWENAKLLTLLGRVAPNVGPSPGVVRADLSGRSLLATEGRARNVLLIVLEGVSGAHIGSISRPNGHAPAFELPSLDSLAQRGVRYTTFLAQQRQTNRGQYALLCGDAPKLLSETPKMSEIATVGRADCLPGALGRSGYETVYLQAAPLAFMMKDQFMPAAGFESVLGESWFERAYSRTRWGVDDRAFFEQSLEKVDELRRREAPWFLMLLTSGTHHPLNVPDEAPSVPGRGEEGRALAWADDAFGHFLRSLESTGVLEDTLVLVTSDESAGVKEGAGGVQRLLSQNWGFLVALVPTGERMVVEAPFAQSDLAVSVLDYLDLVASGRFGGRSIFRSYPESRALVFANTYARIAGLLDRERLVLCRETFDRCQHYTVPEGRLFAEVSRADPPASSMEDRLRNAVAQSRKIPDVEVDLLGDIVLLSGGQVRLDPDRSDDQYLFGGQNLDVPDDTRIEVEIDLALRGRGEIDLAHDLVSQDRTLFSREIRGLSAGEGLRLHYSYFAEKRQRRVMTRLWTSAIRGADLWLDVRVARLRLTRRPKAGAGLDVHELRRFRTASSR